MSLSVSEENDNKDFLIGQSIELIPYYSSIIKNTNTPLEESFDVEKNDNEKSYNFLLDYTKNFNSTQKTTKDFSFVQDYPKNLLNENKNLIHNKDNFDKIFSSKYINPSKFNEIKKNDKSKEKNKCGRKRTLNKDNLYKHNKFSDDNIRQKCKHLLLKSLLDFLNEKIKIMYNGKIGKGIFIKKLRILNQSQTSNGTVEFNINFLNKKLYEIFSEIVTGRLTSVPSEHNKMIITTLLNDEDINKRNFFKKLFELDFKDCLKHFIGEKQIEILKGLKCFNDFKEDIIFKYNEDGNEYFENLKYYLNNYEEIIKKKRPRKSRKKINNIINQIK